MSSRTVDLPITAHSSAAGAEGLPHANPVCIEIPISIQGTAHASSSAPGAHASRPFVEETSTVIVFAEGAVVRLSESVVPGQILIVSHLRTDQEAACRVVSVKANANVKGYVELEFLQPTPGFWGSDRPAVGSPKSPSAAVSRPAPAAETFKAPVAPKPVSPAPAARNSTPATTSPHTAAAAGMTFLPDLLDTLGMASTTKPSAPDHAAHMEAPRPAPVRAEREAAKEVSPAKSPFTAWPVTPTAPPAVKSDVAKPAAPADGTYVSDLLDTLTPIGETILRERPKVAPPTPAPPVSVSTKPTLVPPAAAQSSPAQLPIPSHPSPLNLVEPLSKHSAPAPVAAESAPAAVHASASFPVGVPIVAPEVAPLLSGAEALSRGDMFSGELAIGQSAQSVPKPMRILAVAAAVAVILAAGAGIYRWEKKAGNKLNLTTSSQTTSSASAPAASTVLPSGGNSASNPAPTAASASSSAATQSAAKNPRSTQPPATVPANAPKHAAPRGPAVAALSMSAPTAHSANPTVAVAPDVGRAAPIAAASGILSDTAQSNGPAAPPAVRTSTGVQQPRLLSAPPVVYPFSARAAKVQGDISVDVTIDENGKVVGMTVLSGPTLLRQAALDALRNRKYAPAMLDGKPTSAHVVVVIHFQL